MAAQAFVSYAGEDREVAEAIARDLTSLGVPTFYDRDSLSPGDSIVDRIHDALTQADFGVLVVSPDFLQKDWPQHETRQLVRDYIEGRTRLLPVWHNVTPDQVREHQPALSDIWAVNTEDGLRAVVRELAGQMIEAPTIAVVPVHQQPVQRFRMGHGELTLGIEGPAFNLWEALLHFEPEKFPLFVAGETINRSELLLRAYECIQGDEAAILFSRKISGVLEICAMQSFDFRYQPRTAMKHECHVIERPDGVWTIQTSRNGTGRRFGTQRDAVVAAREALRNTGGGELIVHGRDGRIRDRDTVFSS